MNLEEKVAACTSIEELVLVLHNEHTIEGTLRDWPGDQQATKLKQLAKCEVFPSTLTKKHGIRHKALELLGDYGPESIERWCKSG